MKIKSSIFKLTTAVVCGLILLFVGQACNKNSNLLVTDSTKISGITSDGGNGDGYEGKLLFAHIEPGFTCEGKNAPLLILRRDTDKNWYLTQNYAEKCAKVSNQLVTGVNYNFSGSIISYNQVELVQLITTPWENISLANADLQFPISPSLNIPLGCPINYIPIPARAPYTNKSFCVSKYEMKIQGQAIGVQPYNSAFVAESRPDGTPWGSIMRDDAIAECQALGGGYDLISNDQWQTIAQNAELQALNWTSSIVGVEGMYRGHSDASSVDPISILDINDYYDQTGNDASQLRSFGKEQRRTHFLSNGELIWDLAGNAGEWVKDDFSFVFGADTYINLLSDTLYPLLNPINGQTAKVQFGPSGNYQYLADHEMGGFGYAWINSSGTQISRGQDNNDQNATGVFTTRTGIISTDKSTTLGFRCIYNQ